MKSLITLTVLLAIALDQSTGHSHGEVQFIKPVSSDKNAIISIYEFQMFEDGFKHKYETDNGLYGQLNGKLRNYGGNPPAVPLVFDGEYSYTSPEGKQISIQFVADENGFQPTGESIPTAPPVPEAIQRALEYVAKLKKQQ